MRQLKNFGQRSSKRLRMRTDRQQYALLRSRLTVELQERTDSIRYYILCRACKGAVEVANSPPVATSPGWYVT